MVGPDAQSRPPVTSWAAAARHHKTDDVETRRSKGRCDLGEVGCAASDRLPPVTYVVFDPKKDMRNESELHEVVKAAWSAGGVVVKWVAGDAHNWSSINFLRSGFDRDQQELQNSWDLVIVGDVLEAVSLQQGAELMSKIMHGPWRSSSGLLLLTTSTSKSTNPDLLELEKLRRRYVHSDHASSTCHPSFIPSKCVS